MDPDMDAHYAAMSDVLERPPPIRLEELRPLGLRAVFYPDGYLEMGIPNECPNIRLCFCPIADEGRRTLARIGRGKTSARSTRVAP